jgi:tetraprenyl-beta-curcumene synthase
MRNLISCMRITGKYSKKMYPVIKKKLKEYYGYTGRIRKYTVRSGALESLNQNKFDMAVSSACTIWPGVNVGQATEVIFSFMAIIRYLNSICENSSVVTETFLKVIFSSLKDAVNIRSDEFGKYFTFFPSKDDNGYLSILVEKCRQKVQLLPSYNAVRDTVSAYLALYIDLQITKYSSDDNEKEVNLIRWSTAHGQKYNDISNWEFCMAIDSTLCIQLLLALATAPDMSEENAENIYKSYFPWLSCIHKILEGYLKYNDDLSSGNLNYVFYYNSLKEYEDRIHFFAKKALSESTGYKRNIKSVLKMLLSLYITEPKASEGMNNITSESLYKTGGSGMWIYTRSVKLLRSMRKF